MTIERMIQIGDELKTLAPELGKLDGFEAPQLALPPGTPLFTTIDKAAKLFSVGENTMRALLKRNADFPAVRAGTKYLVDVLALYWWMHERLGQTLETD